MSAWIARIEKRLGTSLIPELRSLYAAADGEAGYYEFPGPASEGRAMRLLPAAEVIAAFDGFCRFGSLRGSAPFWRGSNGEFALAFLSGPLTGRVYIIDYDGRNESVSYRTVNSFVDSLNEGAAERVNWYNLRTDYYVYTDYFIWRAGVCKPAAESDLAADREAVAALRAEYASATIKDVFDDHHYAMNILGVTPPSETESILEFLDSDDMWIQARSCRIVGHRRFEPAIQKLGVVACEGTANGATAAMDALGRIGTPAAVEELRRIAPRIEKGLENYFNSVLRRYDIEL